MPGLFERCARRGRAPAASLLLLAGLPGAASAATATGTAVFPQGPDTNFISFSATGDDAAATGTMVLRATSPEGNVFPYEATVVCLDVAPAGSGNRAAVVGRVTAPPQNAGQSLTFYVEDHGTPGAGLDRARATLNVNPPLIPCSASPTAVTHHERGDRGHSGGRARRGRRRRW